MRIAAFVFLALYTLVGIRYVVWVRAWEHAEQSVREGAGLAHKCRGCVPTPLVAKWIAIIIGCTLDAAIWPINVIITRTLGVPQEPIEHNDE